MQHIKAIIWDMDGVKYELDEAFRNQWRGRTVAAVQKYKPDLSRDEALAIGTQSFEKYHSSFDFLVKEHGVDFAEVSAFFHTGIDHSVLSPADESYRQAMQDCNVTHALLTHSNRSWSRQLLDYLGLTSFFADNHFFTIDDIYPYKKGSHREPFEKVLQQLHCAPEHAIMVEDSAINLRIPKELGMTTVLVRPKADYQQDAFVDYMYATPQVFMTDFIRQRVQAQVA